MQFTLRSIFLAFVVVGSALGAFGPWGLAVGLVIVAGVAAVAKGQMTPLGCVLTLAVLWILVACLGLPAVQTAREAARRAQCSNNLKQIALALLNYETVYGSLPPAYVPGPDGKPWHSWRVLILPFLEQLSLYQAYNFSEPWNGPNNSKLAATLPSVYVCPSSGTRAQGKQTASYVAVVGPRTMWPGAAPRRFREVKDGLSNTILVVEAAPAGIHWMEPRDLDFEELAAPGKRDPAQHPLGVHGGESGWFVVRDYSGTTNIALADGSVHAIPWNTPDGLGALLTVDGGEGVASEDLLPPPPPKYRPHWPHVLSLVTLVLSTVLFWLSVRRPVKATSPPAPGCPS